MTAMPPLKVFLSEDWIGGAGVGRVVESGMSSVVSPSAGALLRFAETALEGAGGVPQAVGLMSDIGSQFVDVVQGGGATNIAGFAATAIQLFVGRLARSIAEGGLKAKANALQAQWDVASYLVLRRQALAADIPGGANFNYVQPGWKKDWPDAAVPPVPHSRFTFSDGTPGWRRLVLFEKGTPADVKFNTDCFSLGQGGCEVPPEAQVGLSLLTYPIMVDDWDLPWGGAQLTPFVASLTSPTVLHVQVRESMVAALTERMRSVMRSVWRIKHGPPFASDAVTLWPDGSYTEPVTDQKKFQKGREDKINAAYAKWVQAWKDSGEKVTLEEWGKKHPWVPPLIPHEDAGPFIVDTYEGVTRFGQTEAGAWISPVWSNLEWVSQAFRTIQRFNQCRHACLNHFASLPAEVQKLARKSPDFSDEKIAAWGGPNGGTPPAPKPAAKAKPSGPKRVGRTPEQEAEILKRRQDLWVYGTGALVGTAAIGATIFQRVRRYSSGGR